MLEVKSWPIENRDCPSMRGVYLTEAGSAPSYGHRKPSRCIFFTMWVVVVVVVVVVFTFNHRQIESVVTG